MAPGPIQGEHQEAVHTLAECVPSGQFLQLADEVGLASELELQLESLLRRGQPFLLEAFEVRAGPRLVGEVGKRRPPPESERLSQGLERLLRVAFIA